MSYSNGSTSVLGLLLPAMVIIIHMLMAIDDVENLVDGKIRVLSSNRAIARSQPFASALPRKSERIACYMLWVNGVNLRLYAE